MPTPSRPHRPRPSALCAIGLTAATLSACAHPDDGWDLLRASSTVIGESADDAPGPRVFPENPSADASAATTLHTVNPPAESLAYPEAKADLETDTDPQAGPGAGADHDIIARLDRYAATPDDAMRLNLTGALELAQKSARELLSAEEDYLLSAISLLTERHAWSPQFFDRASATLNGSFADGADRTLSILNELGVSQRLPAGGQVQASLLFSATEQLRTVATDDYTQAATLRLSADIPLLRGAGQTARESIIQAERNLIYAARDYERFRRSFLVSIAQDYFGLLNQLDGIRNQELSLKRQGESFDRTRAMVDAGRTPEFQARQFEQQILQGRSSLINQRESYILSLDRFKVRLGLPAHTPIAIDPEGLTLPEPAAGPSESALAALRYRLDLQNTRDRLDDARRSVINARNQLLPDLDLTGSLSASTASDDRVGGLNLDVADTDFSAGVSFDVPLDRVSERLNVRRSAISYERAIRNHDLTRDNIVIDARRVRRRIDQQRITIELAERRVETTKLQLEELELKDASPFNITEAQDDLLNAENDRDQAIQDLRTAILDYLLTTGQLRVDRNGALIPPGTPAPGTPAPGRPAPGGSVPGGSAHGRPAPGSPAL